MPILEKDRYSMITSKMTSSASPVNPSYEEQPILDSIFKLKHQIVHLKQSGRANLQDVTKMSSKLNGVVSELRSIRQDEKVTQRNQIDDILDFIWLLLFQIWGTIAHVDRRLYSIYEKLSICLARLEVMIESGVYQADCLASIQKIVDQVEEKHFKDGKFLDKGDEIMYGQAILSAILAKIRILN